MFNNIISLRVAGEVGDGNVDIFFLLKSINICLNNNKKKMYRKYTVEKII